MSEEHDFTEISYFCKMKTWTLEEAARIVCGLNPKKKLDLSNPVHAKALTIQILLERAHEDDIEYHRPTQILTILNDLEIPIPEILLELCNKYDNVNYKTGFLVAHEDTKRRLRILKAKYNKLKDDSEEANPKLRNNLYRLIYGAISMKYRNPARDNEIMIAELFRLVEQYEGAPQTRSLDDSLDAVFSYINTLSRAPKPSA